MKKNFNGERTSTSWEKVSPWYNKITQNSGHYYHEHVVIPGVLRLLGLSPKFPKSPQSPQSVLDLACGSGVLGRAIPKGIDYLGIDVAPSLINEAKRTDRNHLHKYFVADITESLISRIPQITPNSFNAATLILALQNIKDPKAVFENISNLLIANGYLLIVLNHPAFRIPRQSSWGIDDERKIQYRRVDKYMSPMEIPINMNPSDRNSERTMSYHYPISYYSSILSDSGFLIESIEEWTSDKESVGKASKMENRSRSEIPLFMAILASKK